MPKGKLSTYARLKKARIRDVYGKPDKGWCEDIIAGRVLRYKLPAD